MRKQSFAAALAAAVLGFGLGPPASGFAQTPGSSSATGSSAGAPAIGMSQEQIRRLLRARGFDEIHWIEPEGGYYVGEGELHGERTRFRADGRTGALREPERLTEGQMRKLLESQGYAEVEFGEALGETYKVRAERGGRPMDLRVDARRGTILHQAVRAD